MKVFLFLLTYVSVGAVALAQSTKTLPAGIRTVSVRTGLISGLNQKYSDAGQIESLSDAKSIKFDSQALLHLSAESRNLIQVLNTTGPQGLGNQLNLGTIKVDALPSVQYTAPIFAYGLRKYWTLAFSIPVIKFRNSVKLSLEGSNVDSYKALGLEGLSDDLKRALNTDVIAETEATLAEKGYLPLDNRDQTFVGDIQLVSLFRFYSDKSTQRLLKTTISLPTGPAYNPDDLMVPNTFGRLSVDNTVVFGFQMSSRFSLNPYAGVQIHLPDRVQMRVPNSDFDTLPAANQKRTVGRWIGPLARLGTEANYQFTRAWSASAGAELNAKASDQYTGSGDELRYDLLSKATDSSSTVINFGATFSSVAAFMAKRAMVPGTLGITFSDTVAGRNTLRETKTELSLMIFF